MSDSFPLVNLRQTIDKQWEQVEITQTLVVPAGKVLKLREVPDDGSVSPKISIAGLTETTTYPPATGHYYVNYCTGYIEFHDDQVGDTVDITYWAKGSLVESEDINYLNNKHIIDSVSPTGYYGQQWYNTNNGITYSYDIRDKWLSLDRQNLVFGRRGKSKAQYLNYYAGTLPSVSSGLRLIRDACITGISVQIKHIGTCEFHIRKNNSAVTVAQLNVITDYGNEDDSISVDLNKGDIIQCYIDVALGDVRDPMIIMELAWR